MSSSAVTSNQTAQAGAQYNPAAPPAAERVGQIFEDLVGGLANVGDVPGEQLASLYALHYRALELECSPLNAQRRMKITQIGGQLLKKGVDQNAIITSEKCRFINELFNTEAVRFEGGVYKVAKSPAVRQSLSLNNITHREGRELLIENGQEFDRWLKALIDTKRAHVEVNRRFKECFKEEGQDWDVSLNMDSLDRFVVVIGNPSSKKLYCLFILFQELKFIPRETLFTEKTQIPTLSAEQIRRVAAYFKAQEAFKVRFEEVFEVVDEDAVVATGEEDVANFFVMSLRKSDEEFKQLGIEKDVVTKIRQEKGALIYPAAAQVQTESNDLMDLLEGYYEELGFKDPNGKPKTFILDSKGPGEIHKSNLSEEEFNKIRERLDTLFFIHQATGRGLEEVMNDELDGNLVKSYTGLRVQKLTDLINGANVPQRLKEQFARRLEHLKRQRDFAAVEAQEEPILNDFLDHCSVAGRRAVLPPPGADITPQNMRARIYNNRSLNLEQRGEEVCNVFERNAHFGYAKDRADRVKESHEANHLLKALNDFRRVTAQRVQYSTVIGTMGVEIFEQCVYRLEKGGIMQDRIDSFFNMFCATDWPGCADGYSGKIQDLAQQLGTGEGLDQALLDFRLGLITEFVNFYWGEDYLSVHYQTCMKTRLNQEFGLGVQFKEHGNYGDDKTNDARRYVRSNYTPQEIFRIIYESKKQEVELAFEEGTAAAFKRLMSSLGLTEEESQRYIDEKTYSYNRLAIDFDLRILVVNFCIKNGYLTWGENREIETKMKKVNFLKTGRNPIQRDNQWD